MKTLFTESERRVLREATYEADRAARMKAYGVYKKVESYLRKQAPDYLDLVDVNTPNGMGLALPLGAARLPEHLKVVLTPPGNSKMHYQGKHVTPSHVIYVGGVMKAPWNRENLYDRLKMLKDQFVHEYIHAMDFQRGVEKDVGRNLGARGAVAAKGPMTAHPALYMRDPAEFNAWYQTAAFNAEQGITQTLNGIRQRGRDTVLGKMLVKQLQTWYANFNSFVKYVEAGSKYIPALRGSKKWNRKWLKRLHGLYLELKPRVDKELKRLATTESAGPFSALVSKYKAKGWKIHLYDDGEDRWELSQVVVPEDARGRGEGSAFMKELGSIADRHGLTIACTPSKDFGATSVPRLKRFYKAHGFVDNKGKNKDYGTRATMLRPPR
jgi:GNAT superfamily N-acetyltransferase